MKTTWTIGTRGGPIRRVFTTLDIAKQWTIREWTVVAGGYDAERHFARHKSGEIEIVPDDDDGLMSYAIRYVGDDRCFAAISERQHCTCCDAVVATRAVVDGEWAPVQPEHAWLPKDLE